MLVDVHLRAMRNHFARLPATSDGRRRLIDCLVCRIGRGNRGIIMKTFLNFFRQFDEINFRDSRLGFEHDAVRLDPAYRDVFVFFPVNRFEVVSEHD